MGTKGEGGFDCEVLCRVARVGSSFCLSVTPVLPTTLHPTALFASGHTEEGTDSAVWYGLPSCSRRESYIHEHPLMCCRVSSLSGGLLRSKGETYTPKSVSASALSLYLSFWTLSHVWVSQRRHSWKSETSTS